MKYTPKDRIIFYGSFHSTEFKSHTLYFEFSLDSISEKWIWRLNIGELAYILPNHYCRWIPKLLSKKANHFKGSFLFEAFAEVLVMWLCFRNVRPCRCRLKAKAFKITLNDLKLIVYLFINKRIRRETVYWDNKVQILGWILIWYSILACYSCPAHCLSSHYSPKDVIERWVWIDRFRTWSS